MYSRWLAVIFIATALGNTLADSNSAVNRTELGTNRINQNVLNVSQRGYYKYNYDCITTAIDCPPDVYDWRCDSTDPLNLNASDGDVTVHVKTWPQNGSLTAIYRKADKWIQLSATVGQPTVWETAAAWLRVWSDRVEYGTKPYTVAVEKYYRWRFQFDEFDAMRSPDGKILVTSADTYTLLASQTRYSPTQLSVDVRFAKFKVKFTAELAKCPRN